jgi:hypothetical protein
VEDEAMNLQVHEMALESERRLLPMQAERGWQIEQAEALNTRQSPVTGRQAGVLLRTVLGRFGQSLQWVGATIRPANAPSA